MHPQVSKARASVAGLSRAVRNGERPPADLAAAKRDLAAANIAAYIEKVVAQAPPFTREQVDRLRVLLEPVRRDLAADRSNVVRARLGELDGGGDHAA